LNPPTNPSHKQTGPGINLDRIFFPSTIRLVHWGWGQRWSSKCWFFHHSTIWPSLRKLHQTSPSPLHVSSLTNLVSVMSYLGNVNL
jgi:hypothetical protein